MSLYSCREGREEGREFALPCLQNLLQQLRVKCNQQLHLESADLPAGLAAAVHPLLCLLVQLLLLVYVATTDCASSGRPRVVCLGHAP
jgi:hypothetical protein